MTLGCQIYTLLDRIVKKHEATRIVDDTYMVVLGDSHNVDGEVRTVRSRELDTAHEMGGSEFVQQCRSRPPSLRPCQRLADSRGK